MGGKKKKRPSTPSRNALSLLACNYSGSSGCRLKPTWCLLGTCLNICLCSVALLLLHLCTWQQLPCPAEQRCALPKAPKAPACPSFASGQAFFNWCFSSRVSGSDQNFSGLSLVLAVEDPESVLLLLWIFLFSSLL